MQRPLSWGLASFLVHCRRPPPNGAAVISNQTIVRTLLMRRDEIQRAKLDLCLNEIASCNYLQYRNLRRIDPIGTATHQRQIRTRTKRTLLAELALAFALVHLFDLFVATVHRQIGPSDLTVSLRNSRICCSDTHYWRRFEPAIVDVRQSAT